MIKEYHTEFFFKQCGSSSGNKQDMIEAVPGFFPTRKKFINFLKKFKSE